MRTRRSILARLGIVTLLTAGLVLVVASESSTSDPKDAKPKISQKKAPPKFEIEFEEATDWEAIEGEFVRIDMERDTDPDLPAAKVLELSRDPKTKKVRSLKIEIAKGPARIVPLAAVKRIKADDKVVYESAKGRKESLEKTQWMARAKKNGVTPWEELTSEQHAAAVKKQQEFMTPVKEAFPDLVLSETNEFLFYTNMPRAQAAPFVKSLDAMHETMCKMYGIKKGTPVWKGKCLVVVFMERSQWDQFREKFLQRAAPASAHATCSSASDGSVTVNGYCGDSLVDFAATLVHETSHGFVHRWRTPVKLPGWVSEGLADLVGITLVPSAKKIPARETAAIADLRSKRRLGDKFFEPDDRITGLQYGVALSLTRFLHKKNAKAYVAFLNGLKEGLPWRESLKQSYQLTTEQLVAAYGQSIGIPDLKE